jgi:hypothetical protein
MNQTDGDIRYHLELLVAEQGLVVGSRGQDQRLGIMRISGVR